MSFVDRALVAVAGAPIKHDLHLSDSQFGALQGLAFVALYCLCGIPLGWLADRVSRRNLIAAGLLFWTAMTAVCGLAHSVGVFALGRIGVGLGEACLVPAGMSLLADVVPARRMAGAVAVFLLGSTAGNVVALLLGGQLLTLLTPIGGVAPWRALFLLACAPGVLMAALMMTIREPARLGVPEASWRELKGALAHLRANARAYGFLTAATACSVTLAQAQAAWIPQFYGRRFGLAPGHSAVLVGWLFLISAPLGQGVGGFVIDRFRARGVAAPSNLILALFCMACLPAAVLFCTATDLRYAAAGYAVFNALVFAATPAGLSGWQALTPSCYRGLTIALLVSAVTLVGVGLGPALVGVLTDQVFHDEKALGSSLLVVILAAGAGGASFALIGRRAFARSAMT